MATAELPANLRAKLDALATRLHRLRLMRGASWFALALVGGAGLAFLLDAWLELPPVVRIVLFAGWLGGMGAALWYGLLRPLRQPVTAAALAAAVEEEYPRLSERLTSTVELSEAADEYHGSAKLVQLLVRETDLKTRALDFQRAAPHHTTEWLAAGAVGALLALAVPLVFWPDQYLGLGRRLLLPWDRRPAVLPFALTVTPGTVHAAKGRPLTVSAELTLTRDGVTLPNVCTLVLTPPDGKSLRLRMPTTDRPNVFAFRIDDVKGDYRYHVEAGAAESDTHTITAVEPVELAPGSPLAVLTPPAYAKSIGTQTVEGLSDLTVLQYGQVTFDCRLTCPAESATLIWTPADKGAKSESIPFALGEDGRSARLELPARASGRFRLVFDAGHGVLTELPPQTLTAQPDQPPAFRRVSGLPEQARAKPTDTLPLELAVADDIALAAVAVEYRVNDGPVQVEDLPLTGIGTPQASGLVPFKLVGKAHDGDLLRFRLRASDTRDVPEAKLGPNVTYFPPGEQWSELRVVRETEPLKQQQITAQRDAIERRLRELIDDLSRNQRKLYRLHREINQNKVTPREQDATLKAINEAHESITSRLNELVRAANMLGLKPLADKAQKVAEEELRQATDNLRDAGPAKDKARVAPLVRAERATVEARDKLEELIQENRDIAKARLDAAKLEELAERERELAAQAQQANRPEDREKLAEQQKELAQELQKLTEDSEAIKEAVQTNQAEQARKLAQDARKLADAQRDLNAKAQEQERQQNAGKFADLAKKQQELAEQADKLAKATRTPAQAAQAKPLNPEPPAKAAESLKQGDADAALQQQEQAARDLDKLANDLQRGIDLQRDPREAARQLGRLQEQNRQRLRAADQAQAEDRDALRRDEEAIRKAVEQVPVPAANADARQEQREAAEHAAQAARKLQQNDAKGADNQMRQAREALDRMAEALPNEQQRLEQAREEVARLRRFQEEVAQKADRVARLAERNDASSRQQAADERSDALRKQGQIAERLNKLDAPGQEQRRDQAKEAAGRARDDLANNRSPDLGASQQDARNALERLADALAGRTPADAEARELAKQQRELAGEAAKAGNNDDRQRDMQRRQEQIAQKAQSLKAPEAPMRQADAVQSAIQANKALRDQPNSPETARKLQDAAAKLEQLADQLAGGESNAERAERLARRQEAAAQQPPANPLEARRQANQIAAEAKQLRAGEQAAAEKRQAAEALSQLQRTTPGTQDNAQAQKQAAQALRQLADRLNDKTAAAQPEKAAQQQQAARNPGQPTPAGLPNAEQVAKARDLAQQQRQLREQVQQQADRASGQPAGAEQQAAAQRQQELAQQAGELANALEQAAGQMPNEQSQRAAQQASQSAGQAESAMQQAQQGDKPGPARQARRDAQNALDRAAQQADQAAQQAQPGTRRASPNGQPPSPQPGQSIQQAQGQMNQAQGQLSQGQPQSAQQSMQRAAQSLQQASKQLGQPSQSGGQSGSERSEAANMPAQQAGPGQGTPTAGELPADVRRHAGKKWGELPGELRTRILQEMKAQYGDDYARVIKLYFEQIAENNAK